MKILTYLCPVKALLLLACMALFVSSQAQISSKEKRISSQSLDSLGQSSLIDFAPHLYLQVKPNIEELQKSAANKISLSKKQMERDQAVVTDFLATANSIKKVMQTNYEIRNALFNSLYVQTYAAADMALAEKAYWRAIAVGENKKRDSLEIYSGQTSVLYEKILQESFSPKTIAASKKILNSYMNSLQNDINLLQTPPTNAQTIVKTDDVLMRTIAPFARPSFGIDGNTTVMPPYFPPAPTAGPLAPVAITMEKSYTDSVTFSFYDRSDNETNSRILRSEDGFTWHIVALTGKIDKFVLFRFTDKNLQPDKFYSYMIETFNDQGSNRSQPADVYTQNENDHVDVWRVQLRIEMADIAGAGLDAPILVYLGTHFSRFSTYTYLDYSYDDFERNTTNEYDLGFHGIEELSNIENVFIQNNSLSDDCYIKSFSLLVDGKTIYTQVYGESSASARHLQANEGISVTHEQLRNSPDWRQVFGRDNTPLPLTEQTNDGTYRLVLRNSDLTSMIESTIGNLLHTDLEGTLQWFDDGSASSVEVTQESGQRIHVHFALDAILNNWPNPTVDIDFDISFSRLCDGNKLTLSITSSDFETNVDSDLWDDVKTVGFSELSDLVVQYFADNCGLNPQINESLETTLPDEYDCLSLNVTVDGDGNVIICCFRM